MGIKLELTPSMPGEEAVQAAPKLEIAEVKPFDIAEDREKTVRKLAHSQEIEDITATIDIHDLNTIVTFGAGAAEQISRASDVVLKSTNVTQLDRSSEMLKILARIMGQFNENELSDKQGFWDKLFGSARRQLDQILAKYNTMGAEVDRIYVQLRQYETEIRRSNDQLEALFQANLEYFHELEKYVVGGTQGCEEVRAYLEQLQQEYAQTGDQSLTFEIQTVQQALTLLEQRTEDLRVAETVALQAVPMIKMIQYGNMNLVRKIESAFIVTLPVFKQALAQAIMLKRQRMQADAMSALDRRTNELLMKNARNTTEQAGMIARMANAPGVKADTLVTTYRTIMSGIDETERMSVQARAQRQADEEKLAAIKRDFAARAGR